MGNTAREMSIIPSALSYPQTTPHAGAQPRTRSCAAARTQPAPPLRQAVRRALRTAMRRLALRRHSARPYAAAPPAAPPGRAPPGPVPPLRSGLGRCSACRSARPCTAWPCAATPPGIASLLRSPLRPCSSSHCPVAEGKGSECPARAAHSNARNGSPASPTTAYCRSSCSDASI
jgi:hypothetical protein